VALNSQASNDFVGTLEWLNLKKKLRQYQIAIKLDFPQSTYFCMINLDQGMY